MSDPTPVSFSDHGRGRARERRKTWRCFHCDEVFYSHRLAADHFGADEGATPACKLGDASRHLIRIIREQERDLRTYRSEDTHLMRAIWTMEADHRTALRREEEKGYERGLRDGMALQGASS